MYVTPVDDCLLPFGAEAEAVAEAEAGDDAVPVPDAVPEAKAKAKVGA